MAFTSHGNGSIGQGRASHRPRHREDRLLRRVRQGGLRSVALVVSALMVLVGSVTTVAVAAEPTVVFSDAGLTLTVTNFDTYQGQPVAKPGETYTLQLAYQGPSNAGRAVVIDVPDGVDLSGSLTFPSNGAVDSAVAAPDGSTITVTFKDPIPEGSNQGFVSVQFTVDALDDGPGTESLAWQVDGVPHPLTIVVGDPDGFWDETADSLGKSGGLVGGFNLNSVITIDGTGTAVLDTAALDTLLDSLTLTYTVDVVSVAGGTYDFEDTLQDGLVFDPASFLIRTTSWSADGLTSTVGAATPFTPTITGTSASDEVTLPARSRSTITYSVRAATGADRADLVAAVQSAFGAATIGELDGGSFTVRLANDVVMTPPTGPDLEGSSTVDVVGQRAALPGPNTGAAFRKSVDRNLNDVEKTAQRNADGTLDAAGQEELTYTLTADLRELDPTQHANAFDPRFIPTRHVIVSDTLPAGIEWTSAGPTVLADGTALDLTEFPGTAATFAMSSTPGQWLLDGATFMMNVGHDVDSVYAIELDARVVALPASGAGVEVTSNPGDKQWVATRYRLTNTARFAYHDDWNRDRSYSPSVTSSFVVAKPDGETIDWSSQFDKAASGTYQATVGQSLGIPFVFTVGQQVETDLAKSTITDPLDATVFDVGAPDFLDRIQISGTYDGRPVTKADFDLALGAVVDGHAPLDVTTSAAFVAREGVSGALTKRLNLTVTIPTVVFTGKQTLAIDNSATLHGGDDARWDWVSVASARATSYGDELEVTKVVDSGDGWRKSVRIAPDGSADGRILTYRIEVVPHGTFSGLDQLLFDITDTLPDSVDFLGFTDAGGWVVDATQIDLARGLRAKFDATTGRVTIVNNSRQSLGSDPITLYYAVQIMHWTENLGIVNSVDGVKAVVTPTDDYPLVIEKLDATGSSNPDGSTRAPITDRDARFTVTGPDGVVTTEAYVVDGLVVVDDGDGGDTTIVVPDPGEYTVVETVAPRGFVLDPTPTTITVVADEAPDAVQIYDSPAAPESVTVGDRVWVDEDRVGDQTLGEPGIPGVVLRIVGPDGGPVTDVSGRPVGTRTTDGYGNYLFEHLPVLQADEHYTVQIVQDDPSTIAALTPYVPTIPGVGPRTSDSSLWEASSEGLTTGGEEDLTLDFGFVQKTYALGDVVWIDKDSDGTQDTGEPTLDGVAVELYLVGTGGLLTPATDVFGDPVPPQTTLADGRYLFDNLPAGDYRVRFVLTPAQSDLYRFTTVRDTRAPGAAADSDAEVGSDQAIGLTTTITLDDETVGLTGTYDRPFTATQGVDPTWDAGVVRRSVSVGDLVWVDTTRDGRQTPGEPGIPGVVLELVGPDGLPVTDVYGDPVGTRVTGPDGTYLFPNLPVLQPDESYTVRIVTTDPGTQDALRPYLPTGAHAPGGRTGDSDDWEASSEGLTVDGEHDPTLDFGFVVKSYALGDVVWVDDDADGTQDAAETPLVGVGVELLLVDADGDLVPALDVLGNPVPARTTDADGRYLFDDLPAGDYRVRFTLTEKQAARYAFTSVRDPRATTASDSDAVAGSDPAVGLTRVVVLGDSTPGLTTVYDRPFTATQGVDPTWDAGVVHRSVSVGDRVWVDRDRDGRQTPGEPGIPGVVLRIVGPDGQPVVDVDGHPVDPVTTDKDGGYRFGRLPVLEPGQSYTVQIVRDDPSTVAALRPYLPTGAHRGDREGDSSDWEASSQGLTVGDEHDPTLDFGFVLADPPVVDDDDLGGDPAPVGPPEKLAVTGTEAIGTGLAALLLLLVGGAAIALSRRLARRD